MEKSQSLYKKQDFSWNFIKYQGNIMRSRPNFPNHDNIKKINKIKTSGHPEPLLNDNGAMTVCLIFSFAFPIWMQLFFKTIFWWMQSHNEHREGLAVPLNSSIHMCIQCQYCIQSQHTVSHYPDHKLYRCSQDPNRHLWWRAIMVNSF